jgi:hypothetical protein
MAQLHTPLTPGYHVTRLLLSAGGITAALTMKLEQKYATVFLTGDRDNHAEYAVSAKNDSRIYSRMPSVPENAWGATQPQVCKLTKEQNQGETNTKTKYQSLSALTLSSKS